MNTTAQVAEDLTNRSYWSKRRQQKKTKDYVPRGKAPKILNAILRDLRHSEEKPTVCEIGCAPGSRLLHMAALQPDFAYYGVDYSESGIETTRKVLQNSGVNAELLCVDYFKHLPSVPFDLVVSFGTVEHASSAVGAILRHAEYTREGGLVAISIPNYGSRITKWMALRVDPNVFQSHNVNIMNPQRLEQAMLQAGLCDVQIRLSGRSKLRTTCPDKTIPRTCWRAVAKIWNIIARILPPGVPWSTTLWAIGRKTNIVQQPTRVSQTHQT